MADDEEEGFGELLYENGHWAWDEGIEGLDFVSNIRLKSEESYKVVTKLVTAKVKFRDDVDLIEQLRFRRRYQRKLKPGQANVITLQIDANRNAWALNSFVSYWNGATVTQPGESLLTQLDEVDVKDVAIFTAPLSLLSPTLIQILHLNTTERFLRALILYCQYYLQVAKEMEDRILELETKVRTPKCQLVEIVFRDNLSDLRLLVAKEYGTLLIGGADTKRFHHMGPLKKLQSLSNKDARLFETLLRISVQIVWLALGQLEINRLFKSEIFNSAEHTLRTGYIAKMSEEEKVVLLGRCVKQARKLNTRSPLMNEVFCYRPIHYQIMGLGVIKYPKLSPRLRYMQIAVSGPEEEINKFEVTVGILGLQRSFFDTLLRPVSAVDAVSTFVSKGVVRQPSKSTKALHGSTKSQSKSLGNIYPNIILPEMESIDFSSPPTFQDESMTSNPCSNTQRTRWLTRLAKLLHHS